MAESADDGKMRRTFIAITWGIVAIPVGIGGITYILSRAHVAPWSETATMLGIAVTFLSGAVLVAWKLPNSKPLSNISRTDPKREEESN